MIRVISRVITHITGLVTSFITSHEPPGAFKRGLKSKVLAFTATYYFHYEIMGWRRQWHGSRLFWCPGLCGLPILGFGVQGLGV